MDFGDMRTNFLGSDLTILWHFEKWIFKNYQILNSLLLFFQNFLLKFFWTLKSIITWSIFEFTYRWNPLEKLGTLKKVVFIFNKNKGVYMRKRVFDKSGQNSYKSQNIMVFFFLLKNCFFFTKLAIDKYEK